MAKQRCLKVRCHPVLEQFARERFDPDQWEFDPTMSPDRIEATAFGYAKDIQMEIGLALPKN